MGERWQSVEGEISQGEENESTKKNSLARFGFTFKKGGVHLARTMMLSELRILLSRVNPNGVEHESYVAAIERDNILEKLSGTVASDPLEPGQIWCISPGGMDENPGLFRIEVSEGPGSGVRILNKPVPPPFRESLGYAEQNLYTRSDQLVGDKDPRHHEFTVQLRSFDVSKSGSELGLPALVALCSSLLKKSIRGGLIVVGEINLGGSIEHIHNAVTVAEIAIEKGATSLLIPVACRRQLINLSDDMATKIDIQFYSDARDALLKAIVE